MNIKHEHVHLPNVVGKGYGSFWRFKGRYRAVKGSRRSKKSKTMALWVIYHMMKHPQANTLVVRKTYRTLKDSCFTELKWAIKRFGVQHLWSVKESPLEMTYIPTGQKIYFRGLDDPLKVTSIAVEIGVLCWMWIEEAYQTLPWNHRGWHCGGSANNTHIGVEMCEPSTIKYVGGTQITCTDKAKARAVAQRTYDNAVALFAHLCKQYKLDPLTDIISHKEGAVKGIASNHSDPEHLWKQLGMGYTMDTFRKAVKSAMGADMPYVVKISADALNVRKGVGTSYPIVTTVRKGEIYTIVEERNGWGKLKSGVGWISLKYTKKLKG